LPPRATGSISPNFHEGSRSEYLAQYVFSMFGTSVQVPRQEDYGVDLYCTLFSERDGQRVWPEAYYSVQIKSDESALTFPHPKSVEWIVEYPAPLLLCIVQKNDGLIRIYQTFARFGAAVAQTLPESLVLVPEGRESPADGPYGLDEESGNYLLGVPILKFKVEELLDDSRFSQIRDVLRFWVLKDFDNVRRYQMGMRSLWMPWEVVTNEMPRGPESTLSLFVASTEVRAKAETSLSLLLDWLTYPWFSAGEHLDALLAAMLLRSRGSMSVSALLVVNKLRELTDLDTAIGTSSQQDEAAVLDRLLALLREKLGPSDLSRQAEAPENPQ
jgi:hypothetical protein